MYETFINNSILFANNGEFIFLSDSIVIMIPLGKNKVKKNQLLSAMFLVISLIG